MSQFIQKRGLMLVIVLCLLGAAAWAAQSQFASEEAAPEKMEPQVLPVEAVALRQKDFFQVPREFAGVVKPSESTAIGFEVAGRVEEVLVEEGDQVKQGETIALLDRQLLVAQRDQVVAELAAARAQLEELEAGARVEQIAAAEAKLSQLDSELQLARLQLDRREELRARQATSQEELDVLKFQTEVLLAQRQEAKALLDELVNGTRKERIVAQQATVSKLEAARQQADLQLGYGELTAPFDAIVVSRLRDPGAVVSPGQAVLELESVASEIWVGVPPDLVDRFEIGKPFALRIGHCDEPARLRSIIPRLDPKTRTQPLVFLSESQRRLPSGAVARLIVNQPVLCEGFWVPAAALSPGSQGLWAVYVVELDDQQRSVIRRRDVERLHTTADAVFVRGTLAEGEQLVANGVHRLVAGQLVESLPIEWNSDVDNTDQ